jgi:hypothetical protein
VVSGVKHERNPFPEAAAVVVSNGLGVAKAAGQLEQVLGLNRVVVAERGTSLTRGQPREFWW